MSSALRVGDLVYHTRHRTGCVAEPAGTGDPVVQFLSGLRGRVRAAELLVWLRVDDPAPLADSIRRETPLLAVSCVTYWLVLGDEGLADRAAAFLTSTDNPDWLAKAIEELGTWREDRRLEATERLDRASAARGLDPWTKRIGQLVAERAEIDRRRNLRVSLRDAWESLSTGSRNAFAALASENPSWGTDLELSADNEYWADQARSARLSDKTRRDALADEAHHVSKLCAVWLPQLAPGMTGADLEAAGEQLKAARSMFEPVAAWVTEDEERRARVQRARLLTERINEARARRGDPVLDRREMGNVLRNLDRKAADPSRYRNHCWQCEAIVDAGTNETCVYCTWLVCWCGACRSPGWHATDGPATAGRSLGHSQTGTRYPTTGKAASPS